MTADNAQTLLAPRPAYAWLDLGLAHSALNGRESAVNTFASAARADPTMAGALARLRTDLGL